MTNLPAPTSQAVATYSDLERMAHAVAKSGLFGIKTPDQAIALMLIAQAEGLHPAIAARDYDIIQGRPAKKSQAMYRAFLEAGGKVDWHALSDTHVAATFTHPQGGSARIDWDEARAKQAGLWGKDNWKKFPRAMLRARVISEGVQTVYPGAASGMYVPEEVQDFDEPAKPKREPKPAEVKDVTPDPEANSEEARKPAASEKPGDKDAWKDRRALELGFADRRTQTRGVMEFLDDVKGFGLTAEWAAKQMLAMDPPRKTLWALKPDELRLLHEALRKAGDKGERFKSTGPARHSEGRMGREDTPPPEFAEVPDDVPF